MWIATLAIAGIPPFAGFFSKDEILGSVFARAQHSTIASAHLFGIPGSFWLYFAYVLGLGAALMTATYMTRMMIYTFHGPNRTGEEERTAGGTEGQPRHAPGPDSREPSLATSSSSAGHPHHRRGGAAGRGTRGGRRCVRLRRQGTGRPREGHPDLRGR
jgi:NADH:ubiquinone oxidoreductase subunit 5 (subunit L)/multisubunit Na+/H+ antiporter MnhA subunit